MISYEKNVRIHEALFVNKVNITKFFCLFCLFKVGFNNAINKASKLCLTFEEPYIK